MTPSPSVLAPRPGTPARGWPVDRYVKAFEAAWMDSGRASVEAFLPPPDDPAYVPAVGEEFLGFRLEAELGRGAFGRVFLARQGELADRPVALKVSADLTGESQTLAQLQHTNIVPINSIHRAGAVQAVCMPYYGG